MATRFVSSVRTIWQDLGDSLRYCFTFFLGSATFTASTTRPFSLKSATMLSTESWSRRQYWHHVVQNCMRTVFPLVESFVYLSPSRVFAHQFGAASRVSIAAAISARHA